MLGGPHNDDTGKWQFHEGLAILFTPISCHSSWVGGPRFVEFPGRESYRTLGFRATWLSHK